VRRSPDHGWRALEVVDLRGLDEVVGLVCCYCFVLVNGPTILRSCAFDRCDMLVQSGRFLKPADLGVDRDGWPINPVTLGSTARRLLAHQLPADLVPLW
jgi:hypothetical protein